ncbi:MAG: metalloregulator ArsR/SmtB family transcription factor [Burkholderiales bacterium]|nr:metalloregulator ArsR/SmtB family transcription factor [Burkholderiales bacterium]
MDTRQAVEKLAALAQETRLNIFRLLVEAGNEGINASAIAQALDLAPATLSFHVAQLARAGLVEARQESRFIYYSVNYAAMDDMIAYLARNCCQGNACLPNAVDSMEKQRKPVQENHLKGEFMHNRIYNVLFLCTGNSARSIMAEAILNHLGKGRFRAFSAGSHPAGKVNPLTIEQLQRARLSSNDLRSKNWEEFAGPDAVSLDFVFTVCDNAAGEACPVWPGQPMTAHWGIEDPAAVEGSEEEKRRAFSQAFAQLNRRISIFINLPLAKLDAIALKKELDGIGHLQ